MGPEASGAVGGRVGGRGLARVRAVDASLEGGHALFERSQSLLEDLAEREFETLLQGEDVPTEVDDAAGVLVEEEPVLRRDPEGVREVLGQLRGALGERLDGVPDRLPLVVQVGVQVLGDLQGGRPDAGPDFLADPVGDPVLEFLEPGLQLGPERIPHPVSPLLAVLDRLDAGGEIGVGGLDEDIKVLRRRLLSSEQEV